MHFRLSLSVLSVSASFLAVTTGFGGTHRFGDLVGHKSDVHKFTLLVFGASPRKIHGCTNFRSYLSLSDAVHRLTRDPTPTVIVAPTTL